MNGQTLLSFREGWHKKWQALGVYVVPWGWGQDDPAQEAVLAYSVCREYDLDGYIHNAEDAYEFGGAWKSKAFVDRFRTLAPHAPLGLSYIGEGYPYRQLDWTPWIKTGAAMMPQTYWADEATSIDLSVYPAKRAGIPLARLFPTMGTSGFPEKPYPVEAYRRELAKWALRSSSVWLLESTSDDYLRGLQ